jgi:hypothetical protein
MAMSGWRKVARYARIVSSPLGADSVWQPLDYDQAWAPFNELFDFKPDFYERTEPAINLPARGLVIDLAPLFAHEGPASRQVRPHSTLLRCAPSWFAGDQDMIALDWQLTHSGTRPRSTPSPRWTAGQYLSSLTATTTFT